MGGAFAQEHYFRRVSLEELMEALAAALPGISLEAETHESYNPMHDHGPHQSFRIVGTLAGGGTVVVTGFDIPIIRAHVELRDVGWEVFEAVEEGLQRFRGHYDGSPQFGLANARRAFDLGHYQAARDQLARYRARRGVRVNDPRLVELEVELEDEPDALVADALRIAPGALRLWRRLLDQPCPGPFDARHAAWVLAMAEPHSRTAWQRVDERDLGAFAHVVERWLATVEAGPEEPLLAEPADDGFPPVSSRWFEVYTHSGVAVHDVPDTGVQNIELERFFAWRNGRDAPRAQLVPGGESRVVLEWLDPRPPAYPPNLRGWTRLDVRPRRGKAGYWEWIWLEPREGLFAIAQRPLKLFAFGRSDRVESLAVAIASPGVYRRQLKPRSKSPPAPPGYSSVAGRWRVDSERLSMREAERYAGAWLVIEPTRVGMFGFDEGNPKELWYPVDSDLLAWTDGALELVDDDRHGAELMAKLVRRADGAIELVLAGYDALPWGAAVPVRRSMPRGSSGP